MKNNFDRPLKANEVYVQNADGKIISIAFANRALKFLWDNKAELVSIEPLTVRLFEQVEVKHDEEK